MTVNIPASGGWDGSGVGCQGGADCDSLMGREVDVDDTQKGS